MEECGRKVLVFSDKCINSPINVVNIHSYFFLLVNSVVGTASHSNKLLGKFQSLKNYFKIRTKISVRHREIPKYNEVMECGFCKPFGCDLTSSVGLHCCLESKLH